ncbi:MAG: SRPBCC domain-containing protein [Acidimicrobiales bacterium]
MAGARGRIDWSDDGHANVRFDRHIDGVRMEALWAAVTQAAHLAAWLGGSSVVGPVGGAVSLELPRPASGSVTVWDPAWVLEMALVTDGQPGGVLRWDFERDAAGSGIILLHRRLPADVAADWAAGWDVALDALEGHVTGLGPEPGSWAARVAAARAAYLPV